LVLFSDFDLIKKVFGIAESLPFCANRSVK
jgi:hypothetical protein